MNDDLRPLLYSRYILCGVAASIKSGADGSVLDSDQMKDSTWKCANGVYQYRISKVGKDAECGKRQIFCRADRQR